MLKQAGQKVKRLPASVRERISFVRGDMRSWRRGEPFRPDCDSMLFDKSRIGVAGLARDLGSRVAELIAGRTVRGRDYDAEFRGVR
jgi:hypothetical protein